MMTHRLNLVRGLGFYSHEIGMDLTRLNSSVSTGIIFLILPFGPQSLKYLIPDHLRKSLLTPGIGDRQLECFVSIV